MTPHLACRFKIGEVVRKSGETDFMIVKSVEPKRSNKGYTFWHIYCESMDTDEVNVFREWDIISNEPDED